MTLLEPLPDGLLFVSHVIDFVILLHDALHLLIGDVVAFHALFACELPPTSRVAGLPAALHHRAVILVNLQFLLLVQLVS